MSGDHSFPAVPSITLQQLKSLLVLPGPLTLNANISLSHSPSSSSTDSEGVSALEMSLCKERAGFKGCTQCNAGTDTGVRLPSQERL